MIPKGRSQLRDVTRLYKPTMIARKAGQPSQSRVSMGTVFQVPWTRLPAWREGAELLHEAGFHIMALALSEDAVSLDDFVENPPERVAIVLGAEGDGLSRHAIAAADSTVTIPMTGGVDSLNVAAASAVTLWALRIRS